MVTCPHCNSTKVVSVRHDSDWGGQNHQFPVNPREEYTEEEWETNEYGDMNHFACLSCMHEWF